MYFMSLKKKSKSGIATPGPDMKLIRKRIREAEEHAGERENAGKNN